MSRDDDRSDWLATAVKAIGMGLVAAAVIEAKKHPVGHELLCMLENQAPTRRKRPPRKLEAPAGTPLEAYDANGRPIKAELLDD